MADDALSTFIELTGASPAQAQQYLSLADDSVEQAIQLYFETGGSLASGAPQTAAPPQSAPRPPPNRSRQYAEDEDGVVHLDSDEEEDEDDDFEMGGTDEAAPVAGHSVEDDEAMARRMQEEMYAAAGRDPEGVRAPIARQTQTLVGPGSEAYGGDEDIEEMIAHHSAQRAAARAQRMAGGSSRGGIFTQQDVQSSVWEDRDADPAARAAALARATGGVSNTSNKAASLAEMFRPPFEIIQRIPLEHAREEGKDKKKWILVNVQDPSIFDCQVLNRDLWKDERVVAVIKESFIFLQYSKEDPRGQSYMQYYFAANRDVQDAYPHIAIIDPRTGEQVKTWSGRPVPQAGEFLEALVEFLDRYSLDDAKKNPVAKRKADQSKKIDVARLSEEEQLEMALQASLGNGGASLAPKVDDPDDLTKSTDFGSASGKGKAIEGAETSTSAAPAPASPFSLIPSDRPHVEPPAGAETTRIQFRQSQGRIVRRFGLNEPVSRIFEWLKAEPAEGKAGVEFDLMFMGKNLMDLIDQTIEEAGLKNGSVNMEYLGQDEE
ncbi:Mitochondrial presequence protease [Venturia inaequalis]|nr:Mitochondrial presequence protease [Venturia inaequalis]